MKIYQIRYQAPVGGQGFQFNFVIGKNHQGMIT